MRNVLLVGVVVLLAVFGWWLLTASEGDEVARARSAPLAAEPERAEAVALPSLDGEAPDPSPESRTANAPDESHAPKTHRPPRAVSRREI